MDRSNRHPDNTVAVGGWGDEAAVEAYVVPAYLAARRGRPVVAVRANGGHGSRIDVPVTARRVARNIEVGSVTTCSRTDCSLSCDAKPRVCSCCIGTRRRELPASRRGVENGLRSGVVLGNIVPWNSHRIVRRLVRKAGRG